MRLYRTELYKLCHKKIFPAGVIAAFALTFLLFFQNAMAQTSTVDGVTYYGFSAVRMDRRITEAFRGVLTDEKIQQIVVKYGFPEKMVRYQGFIDGNFLNEFVMKYASDGYANDWEDYQPATKALPLDETALGQVAGEEILLEYYGGWTYFSSLYAMAMILVNILILCTVSAVFSGEEQSRMKPLLFTTQEGPGKDVQAKIAASFTAALGLWLAITLFVLLLHGLLFGWEGLKCLTTLVDSTFISTDRLMLQPYGVYLMQLLATNLLGVLELCAVTLAVSARCRSAFRSVCGAALCWAAPLLALSMLHAVLTALGRVLSSCEPDRNVILLLSLVFFLFQCFLYSAPILLNWEDILMELSMSDSYRDFNSIGIVLSFACVMLFACVVSAWKRYRR